MIRAVVFDFGNVICRFDPARMADNLAPYSSFSLEELRSLILKPSELGLRYESGLISSTDFFQNVAAACRLRITEADFIRAFCGIFTPIPETLDLVGRLHGKVKLGLLSNTSEWHYLHGIRTVDVFPFFSAVTLSYQVKAMKPDPAIYRDVLFKLDLPAEECFYADDIPEYVEAARALGFQAETFSSPEALKKAFQDRGILD